MAKENIILTSTKDGKVLQKTLPNINPAATNAQLATFGSMLSALTTDSYAYTKRVTTVNCDTEPGGGIKPEPTLELGQTSVAASAIIDAGNYRNCGAITTNSDGNLYTRANYTDSSKSIAAGIFTSTSGAKLLSLVTAASSAETISVPQTIYVGVTETENFAGKEVAFTITA